jgi:ribosomal protein L23
MPSLNIFSKKKKEEKEKSKSEEKKEKKEETKDVSQFKVSYLNFKPILVGPYLSEKATNLKSLNKYVFEVLKSANKVEAKKAIEKFYNVKVEKVNVIRFKAKTKKLGKC